MASPTLKLLVQIQSDLSGLNAAVEGLKKLQTEAANTHKAGFTLGDAFKFAGVQETLHRTIELVKELGRSLVDVAKEGVNAAAEIQQETFFLEEMIGSADRAKEVLHGIHSIWQQIGMVSDEALTKGAQALAIIGVPLENISSKLVQLSKIWAATNISIEDQINAYQRLRQAIEHNNEAFVRGASAFGISTKLMLDLLRDFLKIPAGEEGVARLGSMFKAGLVSIEDLNQAIRKATTEGGRFDDALERRRQLFTGAMDSMKVAWREMENVIGTPIIISLTPFINFVTDVMHLFLTLAEEKGWQDALKIAWSILVQEIANIIVEVFSRTWALVGSGAVEFLRTLGATLQVLFVDGWKHGFSNEFLEALGKSMTEQIAEGLAKNLGVVLPSELEKQKEELKTKIRSWWESLFPSPDDLPGIDVSKPIEPGPESEEETGKVDQTRQLTEAFHELEAAMAAVHQTQNLIAAAPFMGIDAKQRELISSYKDEIVRIQQGIDKIQAIKDRGLLSAPQIAEATAQIQKAGSAIDVLKQKIAGLQSSFQKSLQDWANSFGSTGHQLANTLQQTVGVALQSINQFLVTGKFNAQALLQQIVLLGLQLIEQMVIQQVIGLINAKASAALAATTGTAIATSMAPAATATTIATHGLAAITAPAAVATALASIMGILGGGAAAVGGATAGLHTGGPVTRSLRRFHSGGLQPDEVPIIAQEGEIMIQRDIAQLPGMADYLLGLNAGMFHKGGFVFGGRYHKGGGGVDVGEPGWFGKFGDQGFVPPWEPPPPLHDPTEIPRGGPQVEIRREPEWAEHGHEPGRAQSLFNRILTFGTAPPAGNPFGSTYNPTFWVNYPGVGPVPMAVPVGGWSPEAALHHMGQDVKTKHGGGLISRFHGGGSVSGGGRGGAGIHIYAFTDLRALTKHMGSKEGQKIIFDTVKGRRIDLGIS